VGLRIPATWAGIRAGEVLQRSGIPCHASLVFGLHQALGCATAGFAVISTLVGRILDWYKRHSNEERDLGVQVVTNFYNHFRKFNYPTQIMGSGFRNVGQVLALAGCDFLLVSPGLWSDLHQSHGRLVRQLTPQSAQSANLHPIVVDQTTFATLHQADQMARAKLEEGLRGYSRSMDNLTSLLAKRLQQINSGSSLSQAAHMIFQTYDSDGDGYVTREEWLGSDAVFDAMDVDRDGKITPDEILIGLGVYL
jgi:transaldolase